VDSATQVLSRPAAAVVAADAATAATMIAAPPAPATRDAPPPAVVEEEEEYQEGGDRPLWPWLVAIGFIIAAAIAGFFVWQELSGAPQVPVINYIGETQAQAEQQIQAAGLHSVVNKVPNAKVTKGKVFKQDPSAGTKIDKGGTVTLTVSKGPPKVTVPDVKGEQWTTAQQALVNAGLQPQKFSVPGSKAGEVTATDPAAGESVPTGSTVRVNVMSGPVTASVPSVVGLSLQQAISRLNAAGFHANPSYQDSTAPANQVISQSPAPGTSATKGSSVTVNVSNGPPQVNVPDVVGYTSQQALQTLESAGFKVVQQTISISDPSQNNIVQQQNPAGGSQATQGSTVTITVGQSSGPPPPTTGTTTTTTTTG
jgi:serine/threonine-protein kinase